VNEKERGRGYLYRLPTEAEWEYACRGGVTSEDECSYHFYFDKPTNDLSSEQANFNGIDPLNPFRKAPEAKSLGRPSRVGAYPSNRLGLCDMHGNVSQWCADDYYAKEQTVLATQLVGLLGGAPFARGALLAAPGLFRGGPVLPPGVSLWVFRGGSWRNVAGVCRAAIRGGLAQFNQSYDLGFRLVRVPVR
jgi:formylglycine-generating enzyme required for sulfatase activity